MSRISRLLSASLTHLKRWICNIGIDYHTIGYRTGEMAAQILKGEKSPSDIKPEYPPEIQLFINKGAAEEQAVEWKSEWDEEAQLVEAAE